VHVENSIQARLCSGRTIASIKQTDVGITYLRNAVAVKEYETHAICVGNHSVVTLPILACGDGIIHLLFDFPNGSAPFA
jgi:hypothetical protein